VVVVACVVDDDLLDDDLLDDDDDVDEVVIGDLDELVVVIEQSGFPIALAMSWHPRSTI
jgi:hypothetical protein